MSYKKTQRQFNKIRKAIHKMKRLTKIEIIKNQKQILELKKSVNKMTNATDSTVTVEWTKQKKESVVKDRNLKFQSEESKE